MDKKDKLIVRIILAFDDLNYYRFFRRSIIQSYDVLLCVLIMKVAIFNSPYNLSVPFFFKCGNIKYKSK